MALYIVEQPFVNGAKREFAVFPDRVRSHLMVIASTSLTSFEASFGDVPADRDGDGTNESSQVNYAPQIPDPATDSGKVKSNFKTLVDRAAPTVLFGVDWTWILSKGGDTSSATPGIQLGDTVIYDTSQANGQGRWFIATDGSKKCVMDAEILYHELVHVVKGHGSNFDPNAPAQEEREARIEEGALERALGRPARHVDRAEAGVGCSGEGPCCIVASVAAGSPYAPTVASLRAVRDRVLRGTQLGEAWFDLLHREYYTFSVPVCRSMVSDSDLMREVSDGLVAPLVAALDLVVKWIDDDDPWALGRRASELAASSPNTVDLDRLIDLLTPLAGWLPRSPHVRWGLVDLVRIWAEFRVVALDGRPSKAIGNDWIARMTAWLGKAPLDDAMAACGRIHDTRPGNVAREFVEQVLTSESSRSAFPASGHSWHP